MDVDIVIHLMRRGRVVWAELIWCLLLTIRVVGMVRPECIFGSHFKGHLIDRRTQFDFIGASSANSILLIEGEGLHLTMGVVVVAIEHAVAEVDHHDKEDEAQ